MTTFVILTSTLFKRKFKKLCRKNYTLAQILDSVISQMRYNPFLPSLKTHKVNVSEYGVVFSTTVTGDIRLIWRFFHEEDRIMLIDIGGHSGKNKVYR